MRIGNLYLTLILLLFGVGTAYSQERRTEICIDFHVKSTEIDSAYSNNAMQIKEMMQFLRLINKDSTLKIVKIFISGAASPEDSYQLNRTLAKGRLTELEKLIRKDINIPDSIITRNDDYIEWKKLKSQIENSKLSNKEEIIAILNEESVLVDYYHPNTHIDNRIVKLKQLDNGKVWQQISNLYFDSMRKACAVFITYKHKLTPVKETAILPDTVIALQKPIVETMSIYTQMEEWTPKFYIKTNAIGLGLGIANVGVEIDLTKHWSFTLPVYYSAWDYFKSTIKFRTFAVQPEFRYWLSEENDGFFAGAHFGLTYYNFAFDGDYRYQDHNRETPAIGGGVSIGYRLPISKNNRWRVEFSLGAGIYSNHYDKFHNTPRTKDGLMIESIMKTYWGIDQAAVSFSYSFDLKKKGGKR